jgi:hypothetical protein
MRARRLAAGIVAVPAVYLVSLVVLGLALRGCVTDRVRDRLAHALDADVTIGDSSLSLLRGTLTLEDVQVTRDHGGHVGIDIDRVDVDLASMGLVIFDRDVERVDIDGARMEISARGMYDLAERREKISAIPIGELDIANSSIVVMPTKLLPRLGRIELVLDRVHTSDVSLRHGLSWLYQMRELDASVNVVGLSFGVRYDRETLGLSGGVFGSTPVDIHFPLPQPGPDGYELATVLQFAKQLSIAVAGQLEDTVKDYVVDWVTDLF